MIAILVDVLGAFGLPVREKKKKVISLPISHAPVTLIDNNTGLHTL